MSARGRNDGNRWTCNQTLVFPKKRQADILAFAMLAGCKRSAGLDRGSPISRSTPFSRQQVLVPFHEPMSFLPYATGQRAIDSSATQLINSSCYS